MTVFDDLFQFRITFGETSLFHKTGRVPLIFVTEFMSISTPEVKFVACLIKIFSTCIRLLVLLDSHIFKLVVLRVS